MQTLQHNFTETIITILNKHFPGYGDIILSNSELLQYINIKTKAANRGSKSRASFANHYAIYVLIEDYLQNEFHIKNSYEDYEGAQYTALKRRQIELPFGNKLQNHALNHRLNEEFKKYFRTSLYLPIIRNSATNRYWINENLLKIQIDNQVINIAESVRDIIDAYIQARMNSFNEFIIYCQKLIEIQEQSSETAIEFIRSLLKPNIDARIFEIVSYAILKQYYAEQKIYWGWSQDELNIDNLILYKTGRTNANDGGIDFVMKPLGRFFQVTETIDVGKYFLDIDKVQKYPVTFVIKTEQEVEYLFSKIEEQARTRYKIKAIIRKYMECVEEVINIPELIIRFNKVLEFQRGIQVIEEIVLQSRVEFNMEEEASEDEV
ncbi:restriction endonuclease [Dolichospermum sp. ST_con]|nr:restriction endonuclease [Dolichospermum sp. ST_con]MDD1419580.1 restriction endonuclease [Dolichospermum sp. ST_sed1]MDD1428636.1 restriction endonuclease [Dolichospermum sp. ST_sed9]MDD1431301.1 restriction endonuclease [Dolichospermum sp. ST_sed6]MDD1437330.1 restriction endonuclease [Dolichospermum sp. ST_sed10]MDD1440047.1 restriction endonuclease [Dolichospermum sp. ST_sed3]MDD1444624.1 restriction endonuclease [Dolichospermum sp. ST_sed8]MDD1457406.1 restriction endonuclease [Dolic